MDVPQERVPGAAPWWHPGPVCPSSLAHSWTGFSVPRPVHHPSSKNAPLRLPAQDLQALVGTAPWSPCRGHCQLSAWDRDCGQRLGTEAADRGWGQRPRTEAADRGWGQATDRGWGQAGDRPSWKLPAPALPSAAAGPSAEAGTESAPRAMLAAPASSPCPTPIAPVASTFSPTSAAFHLCLTSHEPPGLSARLPGPPTL